MGCTAGFLNVPKVKGTHTAMKSAMLAADAITELLQRGTSNEASSYEEALKASWIYKELHGVRNIRTYYHFGGLLPFFALSALSAPRLACFLTPPQRHLHPAGEGAVDVVAWRRGPHEDEASGGVQAHRVPQARREAVV